ncbi:MAG TPA: DUF4199 domain-containing protein [Candidatus Kapabacteria bacterium]|nr:DUF4199 domain-containing protein [Candidatus Kapabacteria bacterium]
MKIYLKWAVFLTAVSIVLMLVFYFAGMSDNPDAGWTKWVGWLVMLVFLFLGVREKKMEDPANFTFAKGWVATFMICLFTGIFMAVWMYVYASFIDPEMIDMQMKLARMSMAANPNISKDQAEQALKMTSFFISPAGFAITMIIGNIIFGAIAGLIISPIVKAVGGKGETPAEPQPGM